MTGLDQEIKLSDLEMGIFKTVEETIQSAVTSGNVEIAVDLANTIIRSGQVRGLALAKLLYEIKKHWSVFEAAGVDDTFEDYMYVSTGRSVQTVTKYVRMWTNIFANDKISDDIKKQLMGKEIGQLLLLTALAGEVDDKEVLEELAEAPDEASLKEIIKRERGEQTSSSTAVRISMQVRDGAKHPVGTLFARIGDDKPEVIGRLDLNPDNEVIFKAVNRILNSAHITEIL